LVTGNRYVTPELKEFETKLLNGEGLLATREYELFQSIRKEISENFSLLKQTAKSTSEIDFYSTLSFVAVENNYTKPEISET
jgi:DNA mismatch repair protein MutS